MGLGSEESQDMSRPAEVENLQLSAVVPFCPLFLQAVTDLDDPEWWLLDSGVSVTVLSTQHASLFGIDLSAMSVEQRDKTLSFASANGSPVMVRSCKICVKILLANELGHQGLSNADTQVLVGHTQRN